MEGVRLELGASREVAEVKVERVQLEPLSLGKSEAWFKLGEAYIIVRFAGKRAKVHIVKGGQLCSSYIIEGQAGERLMVDGVDITDAINEIIGSYNEIFEKYELEERAKAAAVLGGVVPSLPKEWELLVFNFTRLLLERRIVKTFYIQEGGRQVVLGIYCYDNGYYRDCEEELKREVEKIAEESKLLEVRLLPTLVGTVLKRVEMKTLTPFQPKRKCLLFKDKVFVWERFLETGDLDAALVEPNPDIVVMHRIPWRVSTERYRVQRPGLLRFIPPQDINDLLELFKGLAPKSYEAFLAWVKKKEESEEEAKPKVALLLEIIGYTLYPHEYPLHKAVMLVGEGSNGKTTYLKLIERILGEENVAAVSLTELDPNKNRFAAAGLWGKLANVSSEPRKGKFDPNVFKMATGEDRMKFERKHRDAFFGKNYAKMIFSANELPEVTEDIYAWWRRWIVIRFPNVFPEDPSFFERTFTEEEIEGIIICALHAFRLVLKRKGFTEQGVEDPREEWISRSNPIYRVVRRMIAEGIIELDPNGYVVKKDLYELFKAYVQVMSEEEGEEAAPPAVPQRVFTEQLQSLFPIRSGQARVAGQRKAVYYGVRIKSWEKARMLLGDKMETPRGDIDVSAQVE